MLRASCKVGPNDFGVPAGINVGSAALRAASAACAVIVSKLLCRFGCTRGGGVGGGGGGGLDVDVLVGGVLAERFGDFVGVGRGGSVGGGGTPAPPTGGGPGDAALERSSSSCDLACAVPASGGSFKPA
jgi:hypothetical protein